MNETQISPAAKYLPFLKPIVVNGYAVVIATGRAGKVGNKYRGERGGITWGIDWSGEFTSGELCRLTPAEFHALPEHLKITQSTRATKG